MATRYIDVHFCDDIRHEVGNKTSLIGLYGTALFAKEFPLLLPKFCVAVRLVVPVDESLEELRIVIFLGDQELGSIKPGPLEAIKRDAAEPIGGDEPLFRDEPPEVLTILNFNAVFSPLTVNEPTSMRVRVYGLGDEPLRAPKLAFMRAEEDAAASDSTTETGRAAD
ncbi:MAG: hypothetical protein V2J02_18595 [Pseudomonadales bacterium]|nr:hypothetical protein [Pseudomonadales bacterium]